MAADDDILHSFPFFNVYKDGRVHVHRPPSAHLPPSDDPTTGVKVKDIQLPLSHSIPARLFLPPVTSNKLPLLLYVHGGGFCMVSTFQEDYTKFLISLASSARVLIVSVEYRMFPEHPIPACYDDAWEALKWVAAHGDKAEAELEKWIVEHGDLSRLSIAGDSAGGNICHTVAVRAGSIGLPGGLSIDGMILIHPYFGEDDKMWMYMCPENEGPRDRRMRPAMEDLARLGCRRVLVLVAEKDGLREAGIRYAAELRESGWQGAVEVVENVGRDHCFHTRMPEDEEAVANLGRMAAFIQNSK